MAEKTPQEQFQEWMDSQEGYTGKEKKAGWWANQKKGEDNQKRLDGVMGDGPGSFSVSGKANEVAGRIEGLERAKNLTGQNPYEVGENFQQAYGNIKKRSEGTDTGSELLRANKAGAVAGARQQMSQQGVKGGAALGAVSQVERSKAYDVNNQLQDAQRKAEMDYMNATKGVANFTQSSEMNFGQMAMGKDLKGPAQNSNGFGDFGTVICTELYRQGYYSSDVYAADQEYGAKVIAERPHVYLGYRIWADKLVPIMKKSPKFTKAMAFFALPWARNMAGDKNLFGATLSFVFEPICGLIGKAINLTGEKHEDRKA